MAKIWVLLIIKGLKQFSDYSDTRQLLIIPELDKLVTSGVITEERKTEILGIEL